MKHNEKYTQNIFEIKMFGKKTQTFGKKTQTLNNK